MANEYKLGDGLKKLVLAGVGAVAVTAEKSSEIIDTLAKKGEISIEQGKELKSSLKQSYEEKKAKQADEDFSEKLKSMTITEMENLKDIITRAQNKLHEAAEKNEDGETVIDGSAEEVTDAAEEAPAEEAPAEEAPAEEAPVEE